MVIIGLVSAAAFVAMAAVLYFRAHFASTRRMALVPLCAAGMELMAIGLFSSAFVGLTVLLCALRVLLLLCCVGELGRDKRRSDRRRRRRTVLKAQMKHTEPAVRPVFAHGGDLYSVA